jgi:hypothetical protein
VNHQPLILTCDCGYRTPPHGRNGQPLTEGVARQAFAHHKCDGRELRTPTEIVCPECGESRRVSRIDRAGARCRRCAIAASTADLNARHQRQNELDEIAVERIIAGTPPPQSTRAEREAAVAYLTQHGYSADAISRRTRMSERTVVRLRRRRAG